MSLIMHPSLAVKTVLFKIKQHSDGADHSHFNNTVILSFNNNGVYQKGHKKRSFPVGKNEAKLKLTDSALCFKQ